MERLGSKEFAVVKDVQLIAKINFSRGKVGLHNRLNSSDAVRQFSDGLNQATRPLTVLNTADCGDDRRILRFANGVNNPDALRLRVAPQFFGGLGLATTKAATAANAQYLNGVQNITQAYERTVVMLSAKGYEDAGHSDCGASGSVASSAEHEIHSEDLLPAMALFTPIGESEQILIAKNTATKRQRLTDGFYAGWDRGWHEDFLRQRFPQNFAELAVDPEDTEARGHHGSGLYVVTNEGEGFAKNSFIEQTDQEAFAVTTNPMATIADLLGQTEEERLRIKLGFYDDTLHVGAGIVAPDFPAFGQTGM